MTTILDEAALKAALEAVVWEKPVRLFVRDYIEGEKTKVLSVAISAYLSALATPSTGAVGIITGEGENGTEVSWFEGPELPKGTKLYAAPPSSPSERDEAQVPECRGDCDDGPCPWEPKCKRASRSDTVGPEAGE
jgi:hypothetical protein